MTASWKITLPLQCHFDCVNGKGCNHKTETNDTHNNDLYVVT